MSALPTPYAPVLFEGFRRNLRTKAFDRKVREEKPQSTPRKQFADFLCDLRGLSPRAWR
jgi:hypothetical protein